MAISLAVMVVMKWLLLLVFPRVAVITLILLCMCESVCMCGSVWVRVGVCGRGGMGASSCACLYCHVCSVSFSYMTKNWVSDGMEDGEDEGAAARQKKEGAGMYEA